MYINETPCYVLYWWLSLHLASVLPKKTDLTKLKGTNESCKIYLLSMFSDHRVTTNFHKENNMYYNCRTEVVKGKISILSFEQNYLFLGFFITSFGMQRYAPAVLNYLSENNNNNCIADSNKIMKNLKLFRQGRQMSAWKTLQTRPTK